MIPLKLSQNQQNALAELSAAANSLKFHRNNIKLPDISYNIAVRKAEEKFTDVIDRFHGINWGELYDKLHRTGSNYE